MTSKIVRSNGTEISGIKSVVYTETVNAGDGLRPGCVASALIAVEVYGAQSTAPSSGEELTYYQVDENNNETLIGHFFAEPVIPTRQTYSFVAYDAVSKLDKSFSERLNTLNNTTPTVWPMTVYALVSEACSVAGVTLGSSSWPLSTQDVQEFYADNLTCRNILQYAAEIAGKFVRCNAAGQVIFDWYTSASDEIKPGAGVNTVPYKENGLTYDNYAVLTVDCVAIRPSGTEGAAYLYPESFQNVVATDPNGDGNVILTNLIVTDDGQGNLYLSVDATESVGNVQIGASALASNTLILANNLLLTDATNEVYLAAAQNVYNVMSALPTYRHATIDLFPFLNPFRAGQFIQVTDAQGVTFVTPVFTMSTSDAVAQLKSSGPETYEEVPISNTEKALANLSANVVQIDKLKVGWADIQEALVQYLKLYGFMEVYEDNTLTTSGGKLGFATGSNSFGNGIALLKDEYIEEAGVDYYYGSTVTAGIDALFLGRANGVLKIDGGVEVNEPNFPLHLKFDANGIELAAGGLDDTLAFEQPSVEFSVGSSGSRAYRPVNTFHGYSDFENLTIDNRDVLSELNTLSSGYTDLRYLKPTIISSGSFDDITTPGLYYLSSSTNISGWPESGATNGNLIVLQCWDTRGSGGTIGLKQVFQRYGTPGTADGNIYTRESNDSGVTWGAWTRFAGHLHANSPSISSVRYGVFGDVTSSGTDVEVYVPMNRGIDSGTTIACTAVTNAYIRHSDGGYVGSAGADLTTYIQSAGLRGNGIVVVLRNSNGWGITNNTPISGEAYFSFTFS